MTHETCQERLLDLAYGELGPAESAEVESHLESCEVCRAERARLEGTRAIMRRLEPESPPAHGEHLLLTAARQAAEGRKRRTLFPPVVWRLSLAAAALVVVGTVSFRVLSLRERRRPDIEGRPETFSAYADRPLPPAAAPAPQMAPKGAPARPAKEKTESALEERRTAKATAKREAAKPFATPPPEEKGSLAQADAARERQAVRDEPPMPGPAVSAGAVGSSEASQRLAAEPPRKAKRAFAAEKKERLAEEPGEAASSGSPATPPAPASQPEPPPAAPAAGAPAPPAHADEAEAAPAPEAPPPEPLLSARTWKKDRRIRAIQRLVREVNEAQRRGRLVESARPFQACGPGEDAERRLYALDGRIVKYVRQVGSAEVALTFEQLYDGDGRLRYVFIHGGAVNGAVLEHRIWLDEDGRRLWEEQRWRRGRYPLPAVWPEDDLALAAPAASALRCGGP